MAAVTRSQFVALIPTDNRLTDPASSLWSTYTSVTQAGPTAGVPEAQGSYEVVLQASGNQTAGSSITTYCVQGGMPDMAAISGGLVWRNTSDSATAYRGWEPPTTMAAWEPIAWVASGSTNERVYPHAVTLDDDTVLAAVEYWDGSTGGHGISVYIRSPSTGIWGRVEVYAPSSAANNERAYKPCLVVAGSRVLCFAWIHDPRFGDERVRVRCWVSNDSGLTWSVSSKAATSDTNTFYSTAATSIPVAYQMGRLRAAYSNGQILLLGHLTADDAAVAYADNIFQWASDDLGQNFRTVGYGSGAIGVGNNGAAPDVIATNGGFYVTFLSVPSGGTDADLYGCRLSSAYQPYSAGAVQILNAVATTTTTGTPNEVIDNPEGAVVADESGRIWAYYSSLGVYASDDGGLTWDQVVVGSVDAWDSGTPRKYCAVAQRGRVLIIGNHIPTAGTNDNTLSVSYLGGWSSMNHGALTNVWEVFTTQAFSTGHLPTALATDSGWTLSNTGTSAASLTGSGRERFTIGDGAGLSGSRYVTKTTAAAGEPAVNVQWASRAVQGGNTSFNRVCTRVRTGTNVAGGEITIRQSDTEFMVADSAGNLLLSVTGLTSGPVEFRVGLYCDPTGTPTIQAVVAYRPFDCSEDRSWVISSILTVADDAGAGGNFTIIDWGCIAAASGGSTQVIMDWYYGPFSLSGNTADPSATGIAVGEMSWWQWSPTTHNPSQLSPGRLSSAPVYVAAGVSVAAVDGPALAGDIHVIETRYRYPIENVWHEVARSPRTGWRSTTLAQHDIAWKLSPGLVTVAHRPEGAYTAITLRGINWRTATLSYSDAPASFVSMISIDAASGMSGLTFTRTGATIRANSAGTALYFAQNELAGFTVDLGSSVYRRILGNSEGMWTSSGDFPRCVIQLESAAGADPASGAALSIWSTEVTAYISSQNAIGYRLRIDAQTTVDGYLAIGEARIGPMLILGKSPSAERQVEFVPGVQIDDLPDGSTRAALVAPGRRTVDIAWTDGVRTDEFHGTRSAYVRATGSGGVGSPSIPAATPYSLEGLMRRVGTGFVTYLPRVVYGTDSAIFNRRHQHITGTLGDRVRIETTNAKAAENSTEFVRIATVKIREEV